MKLLTLIEVNKERFDPEIPKLLTDSKTNDVYPFPNMKRYFRKEITKATASQIDFIKELFSLFHKSNSPYFLLGF